MAHHGRRLTRSAPRCAALAGRANALSCRGAALRDLPPTERARQVRKPDVIGTAIHGAGPEVLPSGEGLGTPGFTSR
jgi:hypothetical protein